MPKLRSPKSLLKLCAQFIQLRIYYSDFPASELKSEPINNLEDDAASNSSEKSNNPFHQLPTSLLEEVINSITNVYNKNPIKNEVLVRLISPKLTYAGFYLYTEEYLSLFPKLMRNLQTLDLRSTEAGDRCLKVIGTCFTNLRVLDINSCQNVTDTGIQWLCVDDDGMRNGLCKTLQQLIMYSTNVTKKGVQMAVEHLHALQVLDHDSTFEILVEMAQSAIDKHLPEIPSISFNRLLIKSFGPLSCNSLELVPLLYPSLIRFFISPTKGLRDKDLLSLMSLKKLRVFGIYSLSDDEDEAVDITFSGGIVPLLKVMGHSLEILDISFFDDVDIWTVIEYCPNLLSLCLENHRGTALPGSEIEYSRIENQRFILKKLKRLDYAYNILPRTLHYLMSFPSLVKISICDCDTFTDDFIEKEVKRNVFQNLKWIELFHCDFVTKRGIDALMTDGNSLKKISFHYCENVTLESVYDWKRQARSKNWKLNLNFKDSVNDSEVEL